MDKEKFKIKCEKSQEIQLKFAPNGSAVIIWSQSFVDSTGKSYYGEHSLTFTQLHGGTQRTKIPVFNAQVADVAWSPRSEDFIVISGSQPATITLYDAEGRPTFEFGKLHRNTIRYSPFGNFVCIGGFGNLVGEMDFWDKKEMRQLGKCKAHCAVACEWAPDGRHLLAGVLFPRVRVENEVKLFDYYGNLLKHTKLHEYEVYALEWKPVPEGTF